MSYMTAKDMEAAQEIAGATTTILKIAGEVAAATGVTVGQLRGSSRKAEYSRARELVFYIATREGFNPQQIAAAMLRDQGTVRSALRNAKSRWGEIA